jgi:energy-coupling factor transporter ATP-binding protein EcfA2
MASIDGMAANFRRLDQLARGDTAIHRLDARAKVVATLAFVVVVASFDKYTVAALLPFFVYPIALAALGGLPTVYLARTLSWPSPSPGDRPLQPAFRPQVVLELGSLPISGGWMSCLVDCRSCRADARRGAVLVAVTGFPAVCEALERLGMPKVFAMQMQFLYRYLFVLLEDATRSARALEAALVWPAATPGRASPRCSDASCCEPGSAQNASTWRCRPGPTAVNSTAGTAAISAAGEVAFVARLDGPVLSLRCYDASRLLGALVGGPCRESPSGRAEAQLSHRLSGWHGRAARRVAPHHARRVRRRHRRQWRRQVDPAAASERLSGRQFGRGAGGRRAAEQGQPCRRSGARVGMVFQDPDDQLFMPTVFDDVAFGPLNLGLPPPMPRAQPRRPPSGRRLASARQAAVPAFRRREEARRHRHGALHVAGHSRPGRADQRPRPPRAPATDGAGQGLPPHPDPGQPRPGPGAGTLRAHRRSPRGRVAADGESRDIFRDDALLAQCRPGEALFDAGVPGLWCRRRHPGCCPLASWGSLETSSWLPPAGRSAPTFLP